MPIELKPAAWIGTMVFPTIQEAQKAELVALLDKQDGPDATHLAEVCADSIVRHTDEIVAILTCTPVKKPKKTRSDKGTKRGPKTIVVPDA